MEPLGSPQGAHDAAAHLFGVPHRVEHVDAATAAALKVVCRLLCASLLLLQAAGWQRWCWLENRRWEGASLHLGSPPPPHLLVFFLSDTNREAAEEPTEVTGR